MTPGCTAESCHFRDLQAQFAALGAQPVGISADAVERQREFSHKYSFGYPLLSDPDGLVATQFGVRRARLSLAPTKRQTFVIGTDRRGSEGGQREDRVRGRARRPLTALGAGGAPVVAPAG